MALYQSDTHWSGGSLILRSSLSNTSTLLLEFSEPLIMTSMSVDHVSLAESVPQFPSGHRPPIFALMDPGEEPNTTNQGTHAGPTQRERIIVTTPTSPRMKVILEEKIVVDRWTAKVRPQTPPDHVPWGGSTSPPPKTDDLKRFSGRLDPRFADAPPAREVIGTLQRSRSASKVSRRNVLALGRETPTYGKENHPTSSCGNPVVPSRGLHERNGSHCFSFYPITPKRHPNLAVRRGHKAFPLLKINQVNSGRRRDVTSFDSIPTAFRGSPTTFSPAFHRVPSPAAQNLTLDEMLKNLREKCASFSSRVSLPADWFYRPRSCSKDITKLSDTTSSELNSDEDEWAFAEPLMDMINSFSDDLGAHPTLLKDDILDIPILSRDPCGVLDLKGSGPKTPLVVGNPAEDPLSCPDPPPSFPPRPSLISPSLRARSPKVKKTVRFVDSLALPQETAVDVLEKHTESASPVVSPPHHQKRQSIVFSALIPPSPPLSVVRSLQTAKPTRNSWADTLRNYGLGLPPPPPPRPFSHRYPTSPKLPPFMDRGTINRPLNSSPLRQSYTYESLSEDAEKTPPPFSVSAPHPSLIKRSNTRGRVSFTTRESLKISHPIPITAVPRLKRDGHHMGKDVTGSKNLVVTPLRSIFTKFR